MKRISTTITIVLTLTIFASSSFAKAKPTTSRIVYELGVKIGMAGISFDKGLPQKTTNSFMKKARILAGAIGTTVPRLPKRPAVKAKRTAAILHYLLKTAGKKIGSHIRKKYGRKYSSIFELGIKSLVLGLLYYPGDSMGKSVARALMRAQKNGKVPFRLVKPTLMAVGRKKPHAVVKSNIFSMIAAVRKYYR